MLRCWKEGEENIDQEAIPLVMCINRSVDMISSHPDTRKQLDKAGGVRGRVSVAICYLLGYLEIEGEVPVKHLHLPTTYLGML